MRTLLIILFLLMLASILLITVVASMDRSVLAVGEELLNDRWFQATLIDAYLGFLTFYVWVAYRESAWWRRCSWFVLIMLLGNIAMSIYVLIRLAKWDPATGAAGLLLRPDSAVARDTA